MFKRKDSDIRNRLDSLERDVLRLQKQYDSLSNDYKVLEDKVDYIIVKAHCPVCGSEMRLNKKVLRGQWWSVESINYHLTCPTDNYTVVAHTLKDVFNKIPQKD